MGILDFREIPSASPKLRKARKKMLVKDELDAFEKFAEEYFSKVLSGVVEIGPARGPDNDLDLKVTLNGEAILVSCKHYADGDKAVGADQEHDPVSAIISNGCTKFIGFYSTVPSAGLITKLEGLKRNNRVAFDYEILKNSDIESRLLDKDSAVGWLFAARYFPASYANLFRRFVVPIEHYKEKDLKKTSSTTWELNGPFGATFSGNRIDKAKVLYEANDALSNNVHSSFFTEALKDAIDCFPSHFRYRGDADLTALEHSDVVPDWDCPLVYENKADCNLPLMVCGLWSFWDSRLALEKYLKFSEAGGLLDNPPDNINLISFEAHKLLTYSSFLSIGNIVLRSSGKYRDIFARLMAFCQLSLPAYKGTKSVSFLGDDGKPVVWRFRPGEGLAFLFEKILGN